MVTVPDPAVLGAKLESEMSNLSNEARINLERRITRAMLAHLATHGWKCACIWDSEQTVYPESEAEALAAIFNLDEASVRFIRADAYPEFRTARCLGAAPDPDYDLTVYEVMDHEGVIQRMPANEGKNDWGREDEQLHGVFLVLGEGEDIVSDWNFTEGDPDGFNAAMEAFDAEVAARG